VTVGGGFGVGVETGAGHDTELELVQDEILTQALVITHAVPVLLHVFSCAERLQSPGGGGVGVGLLQVALRPLQVPLQHHFIEPPESTHC